MQNKYSHLVWPDSLQKFFMNTTSHLLDPYPPLKHTGHSYTLMLLFPSESSSHSKALLSEVYFVYLSEPATQLQRKRRMPAPRNKMHTTFLHSHTHHSHHPTPPIILILYYQLKLPIFTSKKIIWDKHQLNPIPLNITS